MSRANRNTDFCIRLSVIGPQTKNISIFLKKESMMCGRYYVDDDTAREIEKLVREVDSKVKNQGSMDIHPSESAVVLTGRRPVLSA